MRNLEFGHAFQIPNPQFLIFKCRAGPFGPAGTCLAIVGHVSRPRRIDGFSYLGPHRYLLTFCTRNRARVFTDADIVDETLEQIRRTRDDEKFELLTHCLMPDHTHLLVEGSTASSDLRRFSKFSKQRSGAQYALKHGGPLWQEGYHDRVLRTEDDTKVIARYILANPVRAGLVEDARLSVQWI